MEEQTVLIPPKLNTYKIYILDKMETPVIYICLMHKIITIFLVIPNNCI